MSGIFEGLRVVEWAHGIAGAYCAKLFADLGADVIKLEPPGGGDPLRARGPFPGDAPNAELSGLFHALNTNKRGITLDPAAGDGAPLLARLLERADLLVEDQPPGRLAQIGFDAARLRALNPRLTVTSITPFGQSGPYAHFHATDLVVFQMSGVGHNTPDAVVDPDHEPPLRVGCDQVEFIAGLAGGAGTLEALFALRQDGIGRHVDVSAQEALAAFAGTGVSVYAYRGQAPSRLKSARRTGGSVNLLPCRDGHIMLVMLEEHQWQSWVQIMGNPEWAENPLFADRQGRAEHWDALELFIIQWTSKHDKDEIVRLSQERRVPVLPVNTPEDVVYSRQFLARDFFSPLQTPGLMQYTIPAAPYRFSRTPWSLRSSAPSLGEHNEEIYRGDLGLADGDLVRLRRTGVI